MTDDASRRRRLGLLAGALALCALVLLVAWRAFHSPGPGELVHVDGASGADTTGLRDTELEADATPATAPRVAPLRSTVAMPLPGVPAEEGARATGPGVLRIRLVDESGELARGLSGTLTLEAWAGAAPKPPRQVLPLPASGTIDVTDLEPRSWSIRVESPHGGRGSATASVRAAATRDVTVQLQWKRVVSVALREADGTPFLVALERVLPKARDRVRAEFTLVDPSGARGSFVPYQTVRTKTADPAHWRTYELEARGDVALTVSCGNVSLGTHVVDARTDVVTIVVPLDSVTKATGTLEVLVVDDVDDRPLPGVNVTVHTLLGAPRNGSTDASGRVRFEGLLAADVGVTAESIGLASDSRSCSIAVGETANVSLRLAKPVSISGNIVFDDGQVRPLDVWIRALRGEVSSTDFCGPRRGDDGTWFEFAGLNAGEYVVGVGSRVVGALNPRALPGGVVYVDARLGDVPGVRLVAPAAFQKQAVRR